MSDYTDLCARLRHNCECDSETMYQCDSCTASYTIESQAREIAELRTWRDEAVRLCAKRNCAGRDRRIRDLEEDNDALRARAEAAEKDAARYRWLRKDGDTTAGFMSDTYADWEPFDENWTDVLDAAIDSAIAAGGE